MYKRWQQIQWTDRHSLSTKPPSPPPKAVLKRRSGTGAPDSGASTPRRGDSTAEASQIGQPSAKQKFTARGTIGQEYANELQMEDAPDQDGKFI